MPELSISLCIQQDLRWSGLPPLNEGSVLVQLSQSGNGDLWVEYL